MTAIRVPPLVFVVAMSLRVDAVELDCTIRPLPGASDEALTKLAKISNDAAKAAALRAINHQGSSIASGGLEIEDGCLLYSFDIKVPGKRGVQEVSVDAGTGRVLRIEHESAGKEALERVAPEVRP